MYHIFRGLALFGLVYCYYLGTSGFDAGMLPVWIFITFIALVLSLKRLSKWLFSFKTVWVLLISGLIVIVLVESIIIYHGSRPFPKSGDHDVIVLGAGLHGDVISLTLRNRLDMAKRYLDQYPESQVILSGGQGEGEWLSEAQAMATYLMNKGIKSDRLILEDQSTNTVENLRYAKAILEAQGKGNKPILIITSDFHVYRAKMIAKDLGMNAKGKGAETLLYLIPNYFLREAFGVVRYWAFKY